MSDPEVPQHEHKSDVDDVVDSANAGLADAEAARGDVVGAAPESTEAPSTAAPTSGSAVDPDLAAFEAAERDHPGTFGAAESSTAESVPSEPAASDSRAHEPVTRESDASDSVGPASVDRDLDATSTTAAAGGAGAAQEYSAAASTDTSIADTAYPSSLADDAQTRVVPSEPVAETVVVAPALQHQPIFVQAPEPPRDRGNRGAAAGIGLLATLAFAILYLATSIGLQALAGDTTLENIGEAALAPLTTWGFWVPVVVFFIGFWLLGAIINRGRWGLWVVFGIIVGLFAWAGHVLGQLFEAPFWLISAREGSELAAEQLLAPLAIAAFIFGRELTIWFGAWVARSGARKTELNAEAQREYERTLEAGPTLSK